MKTIEPIEINGELLYAVQDFATLTFRDKQTIYTFTKRGNAIRKLQSRVYGGKPFILASEYEKYPFTGVGPNSIHRVSHFDPNTGNEFLCEACSAAGADAHAF